MTTRSTLALALVVLTLAPALAGGSDTLSFSAPVRVDSGNRSALETSLALDPSDPDEMAICAPSGVPNLRADTPVVRFTGAGQSYFYLSHDGGNTWAYEEVEMANDLRKFTFEGGDCDVAFDAGGNLYVADLWLGSIGVGVSRDHGATWTGTPVATTAPVVDRPWLVGGPDGTIHMAYHDVQFAMPGMIWYTKSTDHGATWGPAMPIALPTQASAFTWEGNLEVAPNQMDMFLVYTRRPLPLVSFTSGPAPLVGEQVWLAASHDGGITWTQHFISQRPASASYLYPSVALDDGGNLHVVFAQATATDQPVWYTASTDGGLTWTTPVKVLAGVKAYSPWVDARAAGKAAILWYGSPDPKASLSANHDWFHYWALAEGAGTGPITFTTGTTTPSPIFQGKQGSTAEFNMIKMDGEGRVHIGTNAMWTNTSAATPRNQWITQHQVATLG